MLVADLELERELWRCGFDKIAGVDEAGRGPLAGPVVVASVILNPKTSVGLQVADSKKIKEAVRKSLFEEICQNCLAFQIIEIGEEVIDQINILSATLSGMVQAVEGLYPQPSYVLIDGNRLPKLKLPARAVVKGDSKSKSIAAASILAKVRRDEIMLKYAEKFPQWEFEQHKGYPTKRHRELLHRFGPSPIHRTSFRWQ